VRFDFESGGASQSSADIALTSDVSAVWPTLAYWHGFDTSPPPTLRTHNDSTVWLNSPYLTGDMCAALYGPGAPEAGQHLGRT
jgi:hypothetical protein